MSFEAESNSKLTDCSCIPVAFPISSAKQNTQAKNFVGHPDRHTMKLVFVASPLSTQHLRRKSKGSES
jgi:hypothetical protein